MALPSMIALAAAETASHEGGVNPWLVGIGTFVALLVLLLALVFFGGGREHS